MNILRVALPICIYILFLDVFGRVLGPHRIVEAFLAALAATALGMLVSSKAISRT